MNMHSDLNRYLDGAIERDDLLPELQRDADRFDVWTRALGPSQRERAPAWLENRIMVSLPTQPTAPLATRVVAWLLEPRRIRLRPATAFVAVAAVSAFIVLNPKQPAAAPGEPASADGPAMPVSTSSQQVYYRFEFSAPQARSVAVAGTFNNWEKDGVQLQDLDGDGTWTVIVPLRTGVAHRYMFIVDGEQWVTDPRAERYMDDGFGGKNAVIMVSPPASRTL